MSSVTDPILSFSEKLIASHTIPKSKPGKRTANTVWFNSECKAAKRACRKALKRAKKSPSADNVENYRIIRAKSRRTLRASRRYSWQKYVSSINSRTYIKKSGISLVKYLERNRSLVFIISPLMAKI